MIALEEWQVREIENTLRIVANTYNCAERKTCLSRMIMKCWNWVVDALNDVSLESISTQRSISYYMHPGQTPTLNNAK